MTERPPHGRRTSQQLWNRLALTVVALILVLALMSTGAQATSGGRIATACSNETVAVFGKPITVRFVLRGVSCNKAHSLIRTYFHEATNKSCRNAGTVCILALRGDWNCSFTFAGEGPGFAGCFHSSDDRFEVYEVTRRTSTPPNPASFTIPGELFGVAATSANNAWAVGSRVGSTSSATLILHWNGTVWKRVPSPSPGTYAGLNGVAATSASNAWAVGSATGATDTNSATLILHWNGTVWKQVPSQAPAGSTLSGVAATSASSAWAVGSTTNTTLILHWNGTVWKRVPSPSPGTDANLRSVAATSANNAWAVGFTQVGISSAKTLILHWNGTDWKRVPSPSPGANMAAVDGLEGVSATSAGGVWAAGDISCACGPGDSLIERWTGRSWKRVPSPTPGGGTDLISVVGVSARSAWAVGQSGGSTGPKKTVILRWNGTVWKQVRSPSPGASPYLSSVTTTSAGSAWAVGRTSNRSGRMNTLILHWNGRVWQ